MTSHAIATLDEVREAAVRPLKHTGWRFWALFGALGLLAAWGVAAYIVQLIGGLGTAGYSDGSFWGIYEANLVAFIGVSYGGALVSAILRLTGAQWRAPITRMAEAMALCSLLIGALFAIVHVGRPERLWRLIIAPRVGSPITWDFVAIMTYLAATVVFLYLPLIPDVAYLRDRPRHGRVGALLGRLYGLLAMDWQGLPEQHRLLEQGITTLAILIIPLAVLVHSVLSWAFAVTGRPGWNSTIFAPYFVVAALYSGVGMVILVVAAFRRGYRLQRFLRVEHFRNLAYLLFTLGAVYLYFTFAELFTEGYVRTNDAQSLLQALLAGQYAPFFWLFVVAGGVVPLLLIAIPRTRTVAGITTASALVVAGMWLKRLLIIVPPATYPLIGEASADRWGVFRPTWVAVGITVGAASAVPLLLMVFFKAFPLFALHEMEAVAGQPEALPSHSGQALQEGGITG